MAYDPQREFIELHIHGCQTLWKAYTRTMDDYKAALTGNRKRIHFQPHNIPTLKRAADRAFDRYLQAVEVLASYQQMIGIVIIDGPEEKKRFLRIEYKGGDGPIPIIVVSPKKKKPDDDDDRREAA